MNSAAVNPAAVNPAANALRLTTAADRWPLRPALILANGQGTGNKDAATSLTWGQVSAIGRGLIHRLDLGLPRPGLEGDLGHPRVAVVGHVHRDVVLALWGLMDAGLPALLIHPRAPASQRQAILRQLQPDLVLDEESLRPAIAGLPAPSLPSAAATAPGPLEPHDPERPLALLFTSGTSGAAKGVLLSRRAFAASAAASAANLPLTPDDRWLLSLTPAHVGGLSVLTRCLMAGAAVIIDPAPRFDPQHFVDGIGTAGVTIASVVPTMLRRLLNELPPDAPTPPTLRAVLVGGAPAPPALLEAALDRGWPVVPTYGLTEACSQVATQPLNAVDPLGGAGPPLPGVEVRLVDDEIQVRGPTLFSGLYPADDHRDPRTDDGWLATGDLGRWDEHGRLHPVGRRGDLIITGGENVAPTEVEAVLAAHPAVAAACVFGLDDETWGQVVAAALVLARPTAEHLAAATGEATGELQPQPEVSTSLARHLTENLAPHQIPRQIAWLADLATTAGGKLHRRETAARAAPLLRPLMS